MRWIEPMTLRKFMTSLILCLLASQALARDSSGPFRPEVFFAGRTHSTGVLRNLVDGSVTPFTGDTVGRRRPDGSTVFDQTIRFADGKVRQRQWLVAAGDPGKIAVAGTDIVGVGTGDVRGRELHLVSTIRGDAADPFGFTDLDFDQVLTLLPDGRSVYNRSTVRKLGVIVAKAQETFVRVAAGDGRRR